MLTSQNTTQENSKKCSKKENRLFKFTLVILLLLIITFTYCVKSSAVVLQEVTVNEVLYPTLNMVVEDGALFSEFEVSGPGEEYAHFSISANLGEISYDTYEIVVYEDDEVGEIYGKSGQIQTDYGEITSLYRVIPLNIDLWAWTQIYNDTIIWQLWDYGRITSIEAEYHIELPYFNNSILMGTQPLQFDIFDYIERDGVVVNLDLPDIDTIVNKAIEVVESESISNITFQYKGDELRNNNYLTDVYSEDGTKLTVDFKKALSTVLIQPEYHLPDNIVSIEILNYNYVLSNGIITSERESDFYEFYISNQFERSAQITIERQNKEVGILNWLGNAVSGIMNVEIFPNFSLGGLLSVIIMIPIILWILKLVAGG